MRTKFNEQFLTKLMVFTLVAVSIAVSTEGFTDPVNVPKFLILGVLASSIFGMSLYFTHLFWANISKPLLIAIGIFLIFSIFSVFMSESPLSQNLYGTYGRNNGFFTYLFLGIICLTASRLTARAGQHLILKSLLVVGYINLIYCLWVILFGDFISWDNKYGAILGTFGNPNFIGAFLGILFGVILALSFGSDSSNKFKWAAVGLLPLTLFEIVRSNAIQGRVLTGLSIAIVIFFLLKSKKLKYVTWLYSTVAIAIGGFALAGAFQRGPLVDIVYKTSVSLRGQYWLAAWNTGQSHPITGTGMDSFGDWYRRSRDVKAITFPGVNTVVNTAHNVPLDMFAFGGWPLFLSYLSIMLCSFTALIKIIRKLSTYDPVAVALMSAWICYQIQSIISINQIGLAIWGWALSGSLIAYKNFLYQNADAEVRVQKVNKVSVKNRNSTSPGLLLYGFIGAVVGLFVALPPAAADIKLRTAQVSQDANKLEETMVESYFNPNNTQKFALNIQAFESSALFEQSHKYAQEAVKWNPESYDLWRILYLIKNSTSEEKSTAIENMKRLDPLNPDVTSSK